MNKIFQIDEQDVQYIRSLTYEDIGKWCYVLCGCIEGFYATREEAEQRINAIF